MHVMREREQKEGVEKIHKTQVSTQEPSRPTAAIMIDRQPGLQHEMRTRHMSRKSHE